MTFNRSSLTPREIVSELDRYIIGQESAKRAVAVALRNRWRRQQLPESLRAEVLPKNILMIGPTGVGKTEIARRLARLAGAPFIKVEATKFTEVGYVGRDVEQIIRDLVENALHQTRAQMRAKVEIRAKEAALDRIVTALVGSNASEETRRRFREKVLSEELNEHEIEVELQEAPPSMPMFDVGGLPGAQMGVMNLNDMLGGAFGRQRTVRKKTTVAQGLLLAQAEECDNLIDPEHVKLTALESVEQNGIVFLDEIDKICGRGERSGPDISREGVQRDLLPLIEGTTVQTKHGPVNTDHILFIASGAFHLSKPSDLLAELQGRLPIRVELAPLSEEDFFRILSEPEHSLIRQYQELLKTEEVTLEFPEETIRALAALSAQVNQSVENIGARRLHTVLEKLLEDISFSAADRAGTTLILSPQDVQDRVGALAQHADLSRFIL